MGIVLSWKNPRMNEDLLQLFDSSVSFVKIPSVIMHCSRASCEKKEHARDKMILTQQLSLGELPWIKLIKV